MEQTPILEAAEAAVRELNSWYDLEHVQDRRKERMKHSRHCIVLQEQRQVAVDSAELGSCQEEDILLSGDDVAGVLQWCVW